MQHEITLISTTAVGLVYALVGGLIAHRLKLAPLVGYLLAGIAVGPFTPGFVADVHLAPQMAEIGVMLLMFGVGMHFSIADLMSVRFVALPGAIVQMALSTAIGLGLGKIWGWPLGGGLVFGLAASVASTVVLLRALEASGTLDSRAGKIAVGWLIVEDLAMVLVLVLLPALAEPLGGHNPHASPGPATNLFLTLGLTLAKVSAFVALMLIAGKRLFPWILKKIESTGSRELFTLAVVALALGVAFGSAELFGVSFALGSFFAGLVVSEADSSHRAAKDLQPIQDTFSVLFFVAVGMLFDPTIFVRHPFQVLITAGLIVVGKSAIAFGIAALLRCNRQTSLTVAAGLAQIGEFSFILTALGTNLGLLTGDAEQLVLAGALISITANPFIFRLVSKERSELSPKAAESVS